MGKIKFLKDKKGSKYYPVTVGDAVAVEGSTLTKWLRKLTGFIKDTVEGTKLKIQGIEFYNTESEVPSFGYDIPHIDITKAGAIQIGNDSCHVNLDLCSGKFNIYPYTTFNRDVSFKSDVEVNGIFKINRGVFSIEGNEVHIKNDSILTIGDTIIDHDTIRIQQGSFYAIYTNYAAIDYINNLKKIKLTESLDIVPDTGIDNISIKLRSSSKLNLALDSSKDRLNIVAPEIRWIEKIDKSINIEINKSYSATSDNPYYSAGRSLVIIPELEEFQVEPGKYKLPKSYMNFSDFNEIYVIINTTVYRYDRDYAMVNISDDDIVSIALVPNGDRVHISYNCHIDTTIDKEHLLSQELQSIEDNALVTAAALNDLNSRVKSIEDKSEEYVHLFEVYADAQCTRRPIVGKRYNTLYVQINDSTPYLWIVQDNNIVNSLIVCGPAPAFPSDPYEILIYVDYNGNIENQIYEEQGESIISHNTIVKCDFMADEPISFSNNLDISFGPLIKITK